MNEPFVLNLDEPIEAPEVGDVVTVEMCPNPDSGPWRGTMSFSATWLGTVSDGKSLAEAMRLMDELHRERECERARAIEAASYGLEDWQTVCHISGEELADLHPDPRREGE